jgi:hypothetical protein
VILGLCVAGCGAPDEPTLESRSLLDAKASAPAPFAAVPDAEPKPAAGARQPVGGFSALLRADGAHTFYAMADNGFGAKKNSHSFLLRVYRLRADHGSIRVLDWVTLRDPDRKVPFRIINEKTADRLLTGGDFDPESFRREKGGSFWFGDEFGPYLLHTDATGKVLEAPIPLPGVRSPDSPAGGRANLPRSRGFEAMALSTDGKLLYPILEGPVAGDDPRERRLYTFDVARRAYTPGHRVYTVADAKNLVADADAIDAKRLAVLERDDFEGKKAHTKQIVVADLPRDRSGSLKREAVAADLLDLADPDEVSSHGHPGDRGVGKHFAMPYTNIESLVLLGHERAAVVNDTNFADRARNPRRLDDSDLIELRAPALDPD